MNFFGVQMFDMPKPTPHKASDGAFATMAAMAPGRPERGLRTKTPAMHPLLTARSSPSRFDPAEEVSADAVESLLEAARWAPSAGNSQPWAFIVGRRGDRTHARLIRHLTGSSAMWATSAGLLVANLAHRWVQDTDWEYSEFSTYDLGQAVAHMTVQAQALGLSVRQFRAFDRDRVGSDFEVPPHWEVTTMAAIGRAATPGPSEPGQVAAAEPVRDRRPIDDLLWPIAPEPDEPEPPVDGPAKN